MSWDPENPLHSPATLGETHSGTRNLPVFLCSLLEPGPVLTVGASDIAIEAAAAHEVAVVDWDSRRLDRLKRLAWERGVALDLFCRDIEREELGVGARRVANIVCLDVLERLRDDVGVLEKLHRALRPGGRLVVRVRACSWVREEPGRIPRTVRHYDPEMLRESLEEAGFRTVSIRHWNFCGMPGAFVSEKLLRRPHQTGSTPAARRGHWWDRGVDLWFRAVENRVGFPCGVSLIAVGRPHLEKVKARESVLAKDLGRHATREAYEPMASAR
jgi:SAM-dependent methyltransferase